MCGTLAKRRMNTMAALTSKGMWRTLPGKCVALCVCALLLGGCKDPAQEASKKLLEASHVDDVRELLVQGADVNYMDEQGRTPLKNAVKYNEKSVVIHLLQSGANVNAQGPDGSTALHDAAVEGHEELVEILLGNGAHINAKNKRGNTALHEAATFDKHLVVQSLLNHHADASIKNGQGKTAYACALTNHAERSEKYLVSIQMTSALAGVLSICGDKELAYNLERFRDGKLKAGEYPFLAHLCRFRGQGDKKDEFLCADDEAIRFFIGEGADVNAAKEADGVSRPPLQAAIETGKWDVVSTLLEHNATCSLERLDALLRELLRKGTDADRTAALLDIRRKIAGNADRYTDGGSMISQKGTDADSTETLLGTSQKMAGNADRYNDGDSMLVDVILNNDTATAMKLVELLLEKGADPNAADSGIVNNAEGTPLPLSPIHAAAHRDNTRMVSLLREHGADINTLHGGMSDLGRAALCNDAQVCRILLENGAGTDVEDRYGETPLFWAIYNNNAEIVELLLKSGADPQAQSAIYKKPLYKLAKSAEIKALLLGKNPTGRSGR